MKRFSTCCAAATFVLCAVPAFGDLNYQSYDGTLTYAAGGTFENQQPLVFGVDEPDNNIENATGKLWHVVANQEFDPVDRDLLLVTFELSRVDAPRIPANNEVGIAFDSLFFAYWDGIDPVTIVNSEAWIWFKLQSGGTTSQYLLNEYDPGRGGGYWSQDDIADELSYIMDRDENPNLDAVVPNQLDAGITQDIEGVYIQFRAMPEPSSFVLLGIAALTALRHRRRR